MRPRNEPSPRRSDRAGPQDLGHGLLGPFLGSMVAGLVEAASFDKAKWD